MSKKSAQPSQAPAHTAKMRQAAKQPSVHEPAAPTPTPGPRTVKVRALAMGYYDHARRREGDVFMCKAEEFSERWMELVDPATPERTTTAPQALKQEHDRLLGEKQAANADTPQV